MRGTSQWGGILEGLEEEIYLSSSTPQGFRGGKLFVLRFCGGGGKSGYFNTERRCGSSGKPCR